MLMLVDFLLKCLIAVSVLFCIAVVSIDAGSNVRNADSSGISALDQREYSPATDDCLASGSVGDVYAKDKDLSGFVKDKLAIVATNTEHPEVDDGAQYVADHAAGPNGVANSVEFGPIPGIDDSTPESIKRITCKYSLAEVVDDSLIKVPSEFPDVCPSPLPGCSVEGFGDSKVGAVMPCNLERGLVHSLPMSPPKQEHCDLVTLRQVERPPDRNMASVMCLSPGLDVATPVSNSQEEVFVLAQCVLDVRCCYLVCLGFLCDESADLPSCDLWCRAENADVFSCMLDIMYPICIGCMDGGRQFDDEAG
ncbi:hypothetical protein Nepgr_024737 [Nepenthes gracilis]|uniref:Uncharacterized protein n=1 Tax=Nepenthes gracilis TaxID=150966 RepID=A0AAD3T5P0_NEPGR|nr:hypothetical protein Nepgr_024737 [Nepenthes gracilis]